MNLSSIIVLIVVAVCLYFAVKSIKKTGVSSCSGNCSECMKNNKCNKNK